MAPILVLLLLSFSAAAAAEGASMDDIVFHSKHEQQQVVQILNDMGFQRAAMRLMGSDLLIGTHGPVTMFAPTDKAFEQHEAMSKEGLQRHMAHGLFTYTDLQALPYGTKLRGITHDITLTTTTTANYICVNKVLVSHPDLFHHRLLALHGVDAFLDSHSDSDCTLLRL